MNNAVAYNGSKKVKEKLVESVKFSVKNNAMNVNPEQRGAYIESMRPVASKVVDDSMVMMAQLSSTYGVAVQSNAYRAAYKEVRRVLGDSFEILGVFKWYTGYTADGFLYKVLVSSSAKRSIFGFDTCTVWTYNIERNCLCDGKYDMLCNNAIEYLYKMYAR